MITETPNPASPATATAHPRPMFQSLGAVATGILVVFVLATQADLLLLVFACGSILDGLLQSRWEEG